MYDKGRKLEAIIFYKEDLLEVENMIVENMSSRENNKELIDIKITLEDQTLRLKGMESVFKKMDELQITSTDKIEIHAVGLEGNEITQSIYINYYHNHGNIRVSGENKIWVEGMYAVLSNRLNKQKDKYFESKYHRGIFKFFPIISGVFLGLGIINLINFFNKDNYSALFLAIILFILSLILFFKKIDEKISPFVRVYFHSKNKRSKIDKKLILEVIAILLTLVSIIIGTLQLLN